MKGAATIKKRSPCSRAKIAALKVPIFFGHIPIGSHPIGPDHTPETSPAAPDVACHIVSNQRDRMPSAF